MQSNSRLKLFNKIFSCDHKPVIGMIHLPALPGSPDSSLNLDDILSFALQDLSTLISGGINGVLVENFHDSPFYANSVDSVTLSSMAILVNEIVKKSTVPVGVNILRNACLDAMAIASIVSAQFIRCNIWTGAYITDQGLIEGCAQKVKRFRIKTSTNKLGPLVFADVHCKHATPLAKRSLEYEVTDAFERGKADAVIISGDRTGLPTQERDLTLLKEKRLHPIIIGSGLNLSNIEKLLPLADGAIVGSSLKINNKLSEHIDLKKVKSLMKKAKKIKNE